MKIGILLYGIDPEYKGGINSYTLSLLESFGKIDTKNEYFLLCTKKNASFFEKFNFKNYKIETIDPFIGENRIRLLKKAILYRLFIWQGLNCFYRFVDKILYFELIRYLKKFDAVYCPSTVMLPINCSVPSVVSLHDIQQIHYPEYFSFVEKQFRKTVYKETVKTATAIQASSEYMKKDFMKYFSLTEKKVVLIRDGINPIFNKKNIKLRLLKTKYNLKKGYLFYPAQHWLHKNHITLLKALLLLKKNHNLDLQLVLTGEKQYKSNIIYNFIKENNLNNNIIFLGNVNFDDLPTLYFGSSLVIIPTLHESNSLPILEALAMGCKVIASDIEPNLEIEHENLTIFEKLKEETLAEKILNVRTLKKKRKEKNIFEQYNWNKTAREYKKLFENIEYENKKRNF